MKTSIITLKITYDEKSLEDHGHSFEDLKTILEYTFNGSEHNITVESLGDVIEMHKDHPDEDWIPGFYIGGGT